VCAFSGFSLFVKKNVDVICVFLSDCSSLIVFNCEELQACF
jgi:hypothetical protein